MAGNSLEFPCIDRSFCVFTATIVSVSCLLAIFPMKTTVHVSERPKHLDQLSAVKRNYHQGSQRVKECLQVPIEPETTYWFKTYDYDEFHSLHRS